MCVCDIILSPHLVEFFC